MTNQCIGKIISEIDYQKLFPYILSKSNIWNEAYYKSDEEDSLSNDYTEYSFNIIVYLKLVESKREKKN